MFIKKDLRKIPEILRDESDPREQMKLGRRTSEFNGGVRRLCNPKFLPSMCNLKRLSLYDNSLTNLEGFGMFAQTPLEELNVGRNLLRTLPLEFGNVQTLKKLWIDDNQLQEFPLAIVQLEGLETLVLANNVEIGVVPSSIGRLINLKDLNIDRVGISSLPPELGELRALQSLSFRGNQVEEIPDELSASSALTTLAGSSNHISEIPASFSQLSSLTHVFLNGNRITSVPTTLAHGLSALKKINLSNNLIAHFPQALQRRWKVDLAALMDSPPTVTSTPVASPEDDVTELEAVAALDGVVVVLIGNPVLNPGAVEIEFSQPITAAWNSSSSDTHDAAKRQKVQH